MTSGYGPAQSQFQDTILSEIEIFSSKDERLPQRVIYGSNPNGFRFRTLNGNGNDKANQKLRSLKYLNYGFAEEEQRRISDFIQFGLQQRTDDEEESRAQTR